MSGSIFAAVARPLLFRMDAEAAHHLALDALALVSQAPAVLRVLRERHAHDDERLRVRALGRDMANPLGLAAGFDKDARALPALAALGFGHLEVGTVTPRPQPGNARPRIFRLAEDASLVNRMGFPSGGAAEVARRLEDASPAGCAVAVNVGRNKDTANEDAAADCAAAAAAVAAHADWLVVNVSSPNTPGLRALQQGDAVAGLLHAVRRAAPQRPVLLKLAPDLDDASFDAAVDAAADAGVAGVVVANTTVARPPSLRSREAAREGGGLSGPPLLPRAEALVRRAFVRTAGRMVVVGVGGVSSGADAWRLVRAGATLVQAYTGFVYGGPDFPRTVLRGLSLELDRSRLASLSDAVGSG